MAKSMNNFTRDLREYLSRHVLSFIVFSVFLLLLKNTSILISFFRFDSIGPVSILLGLLAFLVSLLQLYTLFKAKKFAWVASLVQILLIYLLSIGTFGFIFRQILDPILSSKEASAHLMTFLLFASEFLKTHWLYKNLK